MATFTIGLDLGGTKLAGALVSDKGEIKKYLKMPLRNKGLKTESKDSTQDVVEEHVTPQKVVRLMVEMVKDLLSDLSLAQIKKQIKGVGLASAGPLNVEMGKLIHPVNFKNWKIVPICELLRKELQKQKLPLKVFFQNDAMAASLGEGWVGGAKGLQTYATITIGTGVGTGVILNGRPVQSQGMGSEWGHCLIDFLSLDAPSSIQRFTAEGYGSGTAILRRAKEAGFEGASTEELVKAIRTGETKYKFAFQDAALALATLVYNLSMGFHLQKVLFSGGLINEKDLFWNDLEKSYTQLIDNLNPSFKAKLGVAKLKDMAGVVGAARLPYL